MEEKDFQRIEQVVGKAVKAEVGKAVKAEVGKAVKAEVGTLKEEIKNVQVQLGGVKEDIKTVQMQLGSFKDEIKEDFRLQVGILSEDFQHELQLVAEGHQMLSEKMDRMRGETDNSMQSIDKKIDAVAVDLAAHRADTEGHKRGYMVKEP